MWPQHAQQWMVEMDKYHWTAEGGLFDRLTPPPLSSEHVQARSKVAADMLLLFDSLDWQMCRGSFKNAAMRCGGNSPS